MDVDFYGAPRKRGTAWYIWPGFCIYRYSMMEKIKPNFLPLYCEGVYLDSGGSNYKILYKYYHPEKTYFATTKNIRIKETGGATSHDQIYHSDFIQIIDNDWLHIINGSNYAHIPGKEETVKKILHNLERIKKLC